MIVYIFIIVFWILVYALRNMFRARGRIQRMVTAARRLGVTIIWT